MPRERLTRRQFGLLSGTTAFSLGLAACGWGESSSSQETFLDTKIKLTVDPVEFEFIGDNLAIYPTYDESTKCVRYSFDTGRFSGKSTLVYEIIDEQLYGPFSKVIIGARKDSSTIRIEGNKVKITPEQTHPAQIPFSCGDCKKQFEGILTVFHRDNNGKVKTVDYLIEKGGQTPTFNSDSIEMYGAWQVFPDNSSTKLTDDGHVSAKLTTIEKEGFGPVAYVYRGFTQPINLPASK